MEKLFDVFVKINGSVSVKGSKEDVCMIDFLGTAEGKYFNGRVMGTGTDTQHISKDGKTRLSARYILEGADISGEQCRIFIENNGSFEEGFVPRIVTDSKTLAQFEDGKLYAEVVCRDKDDVVVSVFGKIS